MNPLKILFLLLLLFLSSESKTMDLIGFNNNSVNTSTKWELITDKVMGGKSTGNLEYFFETSPFIRLEGSVSTENNGGFIQTRSAINIENDDFSFIEINVRGNPGIYFIHIRTGMTILPWQFYAGKFSVSENWKRIIVKLSDFKKSNFYQPSRFSPSDIKSIAFVAYGKDFDARLDVKSAYLKK